MMYMPYLDVYNDFYRLGNRYKIGNNIIILKYKGK